MHRAMRWLLPDPWPWRIAAACLSMLVAGAIIAMPAVAQAQDTGPAIGSTVRVANTDGKSLNLRAGPGIDRAIVAKLGSGDSLTVTGAAQTTGATRWLPVRLASGQAGWVAAAFVVLVSGPAAPLPSLVDAATTAAAAASERAANERVAMNQPASQPDAEKGRQLEVEAKLKFPEVSGREQEITVWVTRDGAPVLGAVVTLETSDGDEDERFRQLDPTDEEGRARRSFDVRREKGTVELQVEAVAPDGGEGRAIVSYFRR